MSANKFIYISRDPQILGGTPVITGTRIPAERIYYLLEQGYTESTIKKEFPQVGVKKIRGALSEVFRVGLANI